MLTSALDENRDEAIRAGAAVLDSEIPPLDKLGVAQDVLTEVDRANDSASCRTSRELSRTGLTTTSGACSSRVSRISSIVR